MSGGLGHNDDPMIRGIMTFFGLLMLAVVGAAGTLIYLFYTMN